MKNTVIIAAGGSGTRIGGNLPKQFIAINNKPVIIHTIEAFAAYDSSIQFIISLPSSFISYWEEQVATLVKQHNIVLCEGGAERFYSVKNALAKTGEGIVAVQDAVRPFASKELIARCFEAAKEYGSAVPVVPVTDSIRQLQDDEASIMLDRSRLRAIQTPQCFHTAVLKKAYEQEFNTSFTDDASLVEAMGAPIHLVDGEATNIKITTPADMEYAAWKLSS